MSYRYIEPLCKRNNTNRPTFYVASSPKDKTCDIWTSTIEKMDFTPSKL